MEVAYLDDIIWLTDCDKKADEAFYLNSEGENET